MELAIDLQTAFYVDGRTGGGLGVHHERAVGDQPLVALAEVGAGQLRDLGVGALDVAELTDRDPAAAGEQAAGDDLDRQFGVAGDDLAQRRYFSTLATWPDQGSRGRTSLAV
ncbi:hypothetical protein [Streptomyces sp. NPDC005303]|uniref:hypothetical protein n=1 Tax=Streptomyces sp. NPDC005303 TaxID=3155713 RepID=UPI0033BCBBAB